MAKKKPAPKAAKKAASPKHKPAPNAELKGLFDDLLAVANTRDSQKAASRLPVSQQDLARELCELASEADSQKEANQLLKQAEASDRKFPLIEVVRGNRAKDPEVALRHYQKAIAHAEERAEKLKARKRLTAAEQDQVMDLLDSHLGMASALEALRRPADAIVHYEAAFEISPGDQETSNSLALSYLAAGRDADAAHLVAQVEGLDYFTKALIEFRRHGSTPVAVNFLRRGHSENQHIIGLLLGEVPFADTPPTDISPGTMGAAEYYLLRALPLWRDTPGAVTWAREILGEESRAPRPTLTERRHQVRDQLAQLKDVRTADLEPWRLTLRDLHPELSQERAWLACLTNSIGDTLYQSSLLDEVPNTETMLELLIDTARERRLRPQELQFDDSRLMKRIESALSSAGIECRLVPRSEDLDSAIENLRQSLVQSMDQGSLVPEAELRAIPESDDVWLVDAQRLPRWVSNDRHQLVRPYSILVVSEHNRTVITQRMEVDEARLPAVVWETLARGMARPMVGQPSRPKEIRVRTHDLRVAIEAKANLAGVRTVVSDNFHALDSAQHDLIDHLTRSDVDEEMFSLVGAGIGLDVIGQLYRAAAQFYMAAPWKQEPPDQSIEVQGGTWTTSKFMTVVGQSGLLQGLCIYESARDFSRTLSESVDIEDISGLTVFFDEPQAISHVDHDAYLDQNWTVAGPEAFPVVMRLQKGKPPEAPNEQDVRMLTAVLEVSPKFVSQSEQSLQLASSAGPLMLSRSSLPKSPRRRRKPDSEA